ncbi:MAG: alpha/beta fold hydrolase [Egibacteraceae bacterium]
MDPEAGKVDRSWDGSHRTDPRYPSGMPLRHRLLTAATAAALGTGAGALWAASRSRPALDPPTSPDPPEGLPPARLVAVPGHGELFVREAGDPASPTLLLLHGWMYPSDLNWWTCYGPLAQIAHVLAVDHRGHGRGTRPSTPFRLSDAADDAAALLRHLDTGPAVAVGYSMGGAVAQLLWQRNPDVVRGLVLCATSSNWTSNVWMRWGWRAMGGLQVLLRLAPRHSWEGLYARQASGELRIPVSRMLGQDPPKELAALLPWIVAELDRGSAEDIAEAGRELGRYDARGWLPGVDVPTTVLCTTADRLVPPHLQRDLAARIPGAGTIEVPLDHDGVITRPDVFVPALLDAVREVLRRG